MNLLLAEDDEVSRLFLIEILQDAGHHVTAVVDGCAVIEVARQERFDLLLIDLNLPGCTGDAALSSLRSDANGLNASTPAIGSTADGSEATRHLLFAAGFSSVLIKPMSAGEVLDALRCEAVVIASDVGEDAPAPEPWNDAQALRASGGNPRIVEALRGLLLRDLPEQSETIRRSARGGLATEALDELHKLRAACRFCGAQRLAQAADRIEQSLEQSLGQSLDSPTSRLADDLLAFERACAELVAIGARGPDGPA